MKALSALKNFIFPQVCLGCKSWDVYLCQNCLNFIKEDNIRVCPMCNKPSFRGYAHRGCIRPLGVDGLTSIFKYNPILKKAILKLKNRFVTDLAETLLELFLSLAGEDKAFTSFVNKKNVLLIPVALHWQKQNWRGFNQSALLGKMIADKLNIAFQPDLLKRVKKEEKINAFRLNKKTFFKNIIIFDDLWITGETIKQCSKVLKKSGAKKVWALTLARQY